MDALAVFMVFGIFVFGTTWLDWICDFVLMPAFIAIILYRCWLLARGIPWANH
jgi:hypothetical protein